MKNQPHGVSHREADKVLRAYGYRGDRQSGSHKQYVSGTGNVITIVQKSPIKEYLVKDILKIVKNS